MPPGNGSGDDGPHAPGHDGGGLPDADSDSDSDSGTGTPTKWKAISLGGDHACALTVDGKAYCWGARLDAFCGDGQPDNKTDFYWRKPHPVAGGHTFTKIAAGHRHTCAIDTQQKLHCWGNNLEGQVGDGGPLSSNDDYAAGLRFSPVPIRSDLSFVDLAAGSDHSCAIDTSAAVYCWGRNADEQAGEKPSSYPYHLATPTPIPSGGQSFESVTANSRHSCAVAQDGKGYCWGYRNDGALGDGQSPYATTATPVLVADGAILWSRIEAGPMQTCGIEKGTGEVYCWGYNQVAQLGIEPIDPIRDIRPSPQKIGFKASALTLLAAQTCAVDPSGAAYCWGLEDSSGVIANGEEYGSETATQSPIPQLVVGGHSFANLSGEAEMVCGTTTGSDIYCWGSATSGRFLDAESTLRNATPIKLPDPS